MGFDAPEIVWSQCQSQLQSELPEQQYNTWIRPLKLKYFDADNERFNDPSNDDVIELLAPNRFVEDWVKSKFLNRIEELFHQLSGNGVVLGISASPANAPQYKQQSEFVGLAGPETWPNGTMRPGFWMSWAARCLRKGPWVSVGPHGARRKRY